MAAGLPTGSCLPGSTWGGPQVNHSTGTPEPGGVADHLTDFGLSPLSGLWLLV
jgi:hypothetical protein